MRQIFSGLVAMAIVVMIVIGVIRGPSLLSLQGKTLTAQAEILARDTEEPVGADPATADDMAALAEALAPVAVIQFGGFDGTTATDVTVAPAIFPDAGVRMAALDVYGADIEALTAAIDGGDWEALFIAERIEARDVVLFGAADVLDDLMSTMAPPAPEVMALAEDADAETTEDAGNGAGETILPSDEPLTDEDTAVAEDEVTDDAMVGFRTMDVTAEKIVLDGLTVFNAGPPPAEDAGEAWGMVAKIADWQRRMAFDRLGIVAARSDVAYTMDLGYATMTTHTVSKTDFLGYHGVYRGDLDVHVSRGMAATTTNEWQGEYAPDDETMTIELAASGIENVRLADLFAILATGTLPTKDETDILSLGRWRTDDARILRNGAEIYGVGSADLDLTSFHWLVPDDVGLSLDGLFVDIESIWGQAEADFAEFLDDETITGIESALRILRAHDLARPTGSYSLAVDWSAETGETSLASQSTLNSYGTETQRIDGVLPSFDAMVEAAEDGAGDMDAVGEALGAEAMESLALTRFEYALADDGGLDNLASMAIEVAKSVDPEQFPQAEGVAQQTPEALRTMVAGLARLGASQAGLADILPQSPAFVAAVADYVTEGGTLTILLDPEDPITPAAIQGLDMSSETAPADLVDRIGLSVAHTPPAGADASDD